MRLGKTQSGFPFLLLLLLTFFAAQALAETSKLSPRARIALTQLRAGANPRDIIELTGGPVTANGDLDVFIQGTVTRAELEAAGAIVRTEVPGGIFTAYLPEAAVDAVAALPGVQRIHGAVTYEPNLNASLPTTMADIQRTAGPGFTGANGAGVLIGDIDTGVSFSHEDFDDAGGNTRIVRIWDQTDAVGPNPSGYAYGSEWLPASIDAGTGVCRERDTNGHGTHVMGILAGDGSGTGGAIAAYTYVGMAPKADIVEVKSDLSDTHIVDGLAYFFGLATTLGQPAVMNMSFGSQYGPHDGTDPLEVAISSLTGAGKLVCVSAGNDAGSISPLYHIHASANAIVPTPASVTMTLSGSASGRIIAVDGYYEATEAMNVTITGPGAFGSFGPVTLGNINGVYPGQPFGTGTTKGQVYIENGLFLTSTNAREVYFEIRGGSTGSTFNGTWTITFTPVSNGPANGRVDLWKFFTSTGAVANFATGLDDSRTLGQPACATGVISCGAWITKTSWTNCANLGISYGATNPPTTVGLRASFSSVGPTRDGRLKPEIIAPGQGIGSTLTKDVTLGACTTASTWYGYLNDNRNHWINQGTSMAAPHVAGAVALLMQKFGPLTQAQALAKLEALALTDGNTGATPNYEYGYGKLRVDVTDPVVAVTSPNGGETFYIAQPQNLTWNASDPVWSGVTNVDLRLSRDNGGSWEDLALGTANTGSFPWVATGPSTFNALFRVTAHDVADNQASDASDAVFEITTSPVPAELALFRAESMDAGVKVSWRYADPDRFVSTRVERAPAGGNDWAAVEARVVDENDASSVLDTDVQGGLTYRYRLQAADRAGNLMTFGPITAVAGRPVTAFALNPVWPNPSRSSANIDFSVPRPSHVAIQVYDVSGRLVATLADNEFGTGRYQAVWDGAGADGPAASGVYFVHLTAPGQNLVQRVTLSR